MDEKKRKRPMQAGKRRKKWREIKEAYANVKLLGPLVVVKPHATRMDGAPLLGAGEVYVTKTGTRYHERWCHILADKWDLGKGGIFVTRIGDVGARDLCQACTDGPKKKPRSKAMALDETL